MSKHNIMDWLAGRNRWQVSFILFAAGALMTLGFAPFHWWPVIFICLPVFYLLLTASTSRAQALWRGFFFGYGYYMAGTWWIANALLIDAAKFAWMLPFSVLGLSAVMALWFVVFAWLVYRLRKYQTPLLFAVLWVLVEYLRSFGLFGFPWNLVGYMSLASLPFAQLASLVGTYGLSFGILLLGLLPLAVTRPLGAQRIVPVLVALFSITAAYTYGTMRLNTPTPMTQTSLRVVQPNIPQQVKGTREGQKLAAQVLGELTPPAKGTAQPDITIWPETAYPFTVREEVARALPDGIRLLLTGAVRAEGFGHDTKIWNSVVAMDEDSHLLAVYDKHQLVPFGEFVPLRHLLPLDKITPGDIDFSRGSGPRTIRLDQVPPFSPLVCYEVIFPGMAVDPAQRPQWMLNVTNDAWYGDSPGPYQHFEMARMRAIEQGLPLVRAANDGVSAVIDGQGRIIRSLGLGQRGIIDTVLPGPVAPTFYHRWSEWPVFGILGLVALYLFYRKYLSER